MATANGVERGSGGQRRRCAGSKSFGSWRSRGRRCRRRGSRRSGVDALELAQLVGELAGDLGREPDGGDLAGDAPAPGGLGLLVVFLVVLLLVLGLVELEHQPVLDLHTGALVGLLGDADRHPLVVHGGGGGEREARRATVADDLHLGGDARCLGLVGEAGAEEAVLRGAVDSALGPGAGLGRLGGLDGGGQLAVEDRLLRARLGAGVGVGVLRLLVVSAAGEAERSGGARGAGGHESEERVHRHPVLSPARPSLPGDQWGVS